MVNQFTNIEFDFKMIDCQYFLDEKNESFEFSENVNKAAVC